MLYFNAEMLLLNNLLETKDSHDKKNCLLIAIRNEFLKYQEHVSVTVQRLVTRTREIRVAKKEKNMTHEHVSKWTNIHSAYIYVHACRITELRTDVIYKT
jgi:hypothetical protein